MATWNKNICLILSTLGLLAFAGCGANPEISVETPKDEPAANAHLKTQLPQKEAETASKQEENPSVRSFRFHYAVTLTELKPGSKARIWIPVAQATPHQNVKIVQANLPSEHRKTGESTYGNELFYCEAKADKKGEIPLEVIYEVTRREVLPETGELFDSSQRELFLQASQLVPVGGKPKDLFLAGFEPADGALSIARRLYDQVDEHVKYDKPAGGKWGRGDAVWVCDSKYGNCTDFHSLFISLCRSVNIPAKFEIGFPLPTERGTGEIGGYHCWAWFAKKGHWIPVDISEADKHPELKEYYFGHLSADRVVFTTGRDLHLEPAPKTGPVNFLVYPHVEVDGIVHREMSRQFRYEDL